jgi:cellulose synthase (UDP-forming)
VPSRTTVAVDDYEHTHHVGSATLLLLLLAGAISALYYGLYLFNPANAGDWLPYMLVLFAEGLIIYQTAVSYWTILAGSYNPKDFKYDLARNALFGHTKYALTYTALHIREARVNVDVFVTVYGEPIDIVRQTATAARDILGLHKTYILDDGKSDAVQALAKELGVYYIGRAGNKGAKAGNINNALRRVTGDFFAVFDADHVPKATFLQETMPFFHSKKVAFVQTPQFYINTHNPIARGAAYAQELFYKFICTGKNRFNAAFCVGTNVVFRRSAIDEIGGIYEKSKSEDIWTALTLHEKGYQSIFIPDILAEGQAPETMPAFIKQQLRWATGGFEILFTHNPLRSKHLDFDQKMQYLATVSFYLLGLAVAALFLVPGLSIFLGLSPVGGGARLGDWALHYLAFYGFQYAIILYCMQGLKFETLILTTCSFPTYLKALWNVIRKHDVGWSVTNQKNAESPYNYMVPQLIIFCFLLFSSGVGVWQIIAGHQPSLALGWNIFNTYLFWRYIRMALTNRGDIPIASKRINKSRLKRKTLRIKESVA